MINLGESVKTLTIIDTFGFFFRLYYAMSSLKTNDGKPIEIENEIDDKW